jgi:hypothetical protein
MKLTVYLSRYGGDIKTLADTSRIPVSDVINYINACHVLRYLEINTGPGETDSKVRKYGTYTGNQTDPDKVSLFKKIRDRLGI